MLFRSAQLKLSFQEVPLGRRGRDNHPGVAIEQEGTAMLDAVSAGDRVIALEVGGKVWSTEQLAGKLEDWQLDGRDVTLLVGGPDGLSAGCRERADEQWSLSPLTLPHPLVRVVLAEQLYRAWTITSNHPYHR